eukprot:358473-Chlamydomonas_euryale.AAC.1
MRRKSDPVGNCVTLAAACSRMPPSFGVRTPARRPGTSSHRAHRRRGGQLHCSRRMRRRVC